MNCKCFTRRVSLLTQLLWHYSFPFRVVVAAAMAAQLLLSVSVATAQIPFNGLEVNQEGAAAWNSAQKTGHPISWTTLGPAYALYYWPVVIM